MRVCHPILGCKVPVCQEIQSRADPSVGMVIPDALRFAGLRLQAIQALSDLGDPPCVGPVPALTIPLNGEFLTKTDLARSLCLNAPDLLAGLLSEGSSPPLENLQRYWRNKLDAAAPMPPPRELDPEWARRFPMADLANGYPAVDAQYLLASLGQEAMWSFAPFDKLYMRGNITLGEAANNILQRSAGLSIKWFEPVPPAYYDRHDGMALLGRMLRENRGVFLSGPEGSGRDALLHAFGQHTAHDPVASSEFGRLRINPVNAIWNAEEGNAEDWSHATRNPPVVIALTQTGLSPEYFEELAHGAVRFFAPLEANNPRRLIVAMGRDELARFCERVPAARSFSVLEVPPVQALDVLPICMCQAFPAGRISIAGVASAIIRLPEENRLVTRGVQAGESPMTWLQRFLRSRSLSESVPSVRRELLDTWVGDNQRIEELRDLEHQLNAGWPTGG